MFEMFSFTDDRKDLAAALVKAQASMGAAVKDSKNPHYRSSYASLSAVIDAVVPCLNEQGVAVMQLPHLDESYVQLTTILMHTSGQMLSSTVATPMGKKQDAQAVGSAITYLRRYALQSIMGLPVEDDDGNAASRRTVQPAARRSLPSTETTAARIASELEAAGLSVQAYTTWAGKAGKPPINAMNPSQQKMCLEWLTHGNGMDIIKAAQ
jgi:hypothetical protein